MLRKFCWVLILVPCEILYFPLAMAGGPPALEWQRTAGAEWDDAGYCIRPTADGGYIVVGYTKPTGSDYDVYLIKLDRQGNIKWQATLGGDKDDKGYDVYQTPDGGYLVVGATSSFGAGNYDIFIIKTDSTGKELWHRAFGGKSNDYPAEFGALQPTPDGGYLVVGYTWSYGQKCDIWLMKLNSFGNMVWNKTIGGADVDFARSIIRCSDGNFVIVGRTTSFGAGKGDVYVVKVDAGGNVLWERAYGGSEGDWANSVVEVSGGGYLVVGGTRSYGNGEDDTYVVRIDFAGNKLWDKAFAESPGDDWGLTILPAQGGRFIISVTLWTCCKKWDAEFLEIDLEGNLLWNLAFGGYMGDEAIYSLQRTPDGGCIGVGETGSYGEGGTDVYLIKVGPEP